MFTYLLTEKIILLAFFFHLIDCFIDFNARTLYESFIRAAGDSGRKLDRDGVSRLLAALKNRKLIQRIGLNKTGCWKVQ